jgi:hypothetical protein
MQDDHERRRPRVHFVTEIILELGGTQHTFLHSHDLSMNGAFIETANPLPIGATGGMNIVLSAGMKHDNLKGRYEVVRVVPIDEGLSSSTEHGSGMGIKFVDLEDESATTLFKLIEYNQET